MTDSQQTRKRTPEEDIRELYSRTAKLNDRVSALLAPSWGSENGILPTDHPLYVGENPSTAEEQAGMDPVHCQGYGEPAPEEQGQSEAAQVAATVHELQTIVNRVREAVATGQPLTPTRTPAEHCGDPKPGFLGDPAAECVLRPGHSGSHADETGCRWWQTTEQALATGQPAPAATEATGAPDTITDPAYLREQYAAALRTRLAEVHAPGSHLEPEAVVDYIGCTEYDLADAVLRVRDRHLQQLRQRLQLADHQHLAIGAWGNAHDRATRAERQRDQLAGILREILARFEPAFPSMDQPMRYQATVPIEDRDRWRAVLDQTQKP